MSADGTEIDLLYTDVEESLRQAVRAALGASCSPNTVMRCYDGDRSLTAPVWQRLTRELGLSGLLVPEQYGGAGATLREAAVVCEEIGRVVAPVPFVESAVVASVVLRTAIVDSGGGAAGDETTASTLLASAAAGDTTMALAVGACGLPAHAGVTVDAKGDVTGQVRNVVGALDADVLLVPVDSGEIRSVRAKDAHVTSVTSLDATRPIADIEFNRTPSTLIASADAGPAAMRAGLQAGAAAIASEQLGIADWCLSETVAYLRERKQFGRVVGGFQALKHRLADMYVAVEQARTAARYAAATVAAGDADAAIGTAVAKTYCSQTAVYVAEEALQLHGGIGMTWEHPMHLYLKRAKADHLLFGTPGHHMDRLAALVNLPPAS